MMNRRSFFQRVAGVSIASAVGGRIATPASAAPATIQRPTLMDNVLHQRLVVGREVWELIPRIAHLSSTTVTVYGESGTGRSFTARMLHERSPWADAPIEYLDCSVPGSVSRASRVIRGSVVLEEVSALNASDQAHLLDCLRQGRRPDRVICTTSARLRQVVQRHAFSEALFYRIDVIAMWLQPLRERREEILMLATDAVARAAAAQGKSMPNLMPATIDRVLRYSWPGNIRELDRVMALAVARAEGGVIGADDIVLTSRS